MGLVTDRARIPFGLIGVLLVVSSALYIAAIDQPDVSRPAVDDAMERTEAEVQTALREAVATAAHHAGRDPVLEPANTTMGTALNETRPFRDALELRIHHRAKRGLDDLSGARGDVDVVVSVPSVRSTEGAERAIDRVRAEPTTADGPAMEVTIDNVSIAAVRDGQVVGEREVSPTITVPTPVLAVHERVETFDTRLDAGVGSPGLTRQLAGQLYPVTWARGYAQYSGTPIQNVVANRHVALLTNGAVLGLQQETFGHSDPVGREILARSTAHVGVADLLDGVDFAPVELLDEVHGEVGLGETPAEALAAYREDVPDGHSSGRRMTVGVNGTADEAFLETAADLDSILESAYSVDARVRAVQVYRARTGGSSASETGEDPTVPDEDDGEAATAVATDEWEERERFERYVEYHPSGIMVHERTDRLPGGDARVDYVELVIETRPAVTPAPDRPIDPLYVPGGVLDGPNFGGVPDEAVDRIVPYPEGRDGLAERASRGSLGVESVTVEAARPDNLTRWVYPQLASLRERVRNVSIERTGGDLATFDSNPAAALAEAIEANRSELLETPEQYDGAADRARVAAKATYLNRTTAELTRRAKDHESRLDGIADRIPDSAVDPITAMQKSYADRTTGAPGRGSPIENLSMTVDASPSYLPTAAVDDGTVPTMEPGTEEHPLVVRNLNLFDLPYGEIADGILSIFSGPDRAQLRTAAQTLEVALASEDAAGERFEYPSHLSTIPGIDADYSTAILANEVRSANAVVGIATNGVLEDVGLGPDESRADVVERAMGRWADPSDTALAIDNGSFARAVHEEAIAEWPDDLENVTERDRLGVRLRVDVRRTLERKWAQPRARAVNGSVDPARSFIRDEISSELENKTQEAVVLKMDDYFERSFDRVPAGLPVAPLPGSWFATVNQWIVQARGEYDRFAVRVPRGSPARPGGGFEYVRDGSNVTLDLTEDGEPDRLGRSTRVSFSTSVFVGIVVPPGSTGVGDVDGEMDERSDGWPDPGPT